MTRDMCHKKADANIRRTPNSGGLSMKGDILCIDDNSILSEFNWECKNQEKLNIWKALEQSRNDCLGNAKMPVVCFTKNHERDYMTAWVIIGLLFIITGLLGFIALMLWAIGDRLSQK